MREEESERASANANCSGALMPLRHDSPQQHGVSGAQLFTPLKLRSLETFHTVKGQRSKLFVWSATCVYVDGGSTTGAQSGARDVSLPRRDHCIQL